MKIYTTILFVLFGILIGNAQDRHIKEKIKKLKIAYFTENLDLTEKEAQQFWPIYNAYDDKHHELRIREMSKIKREVKDMENLSEAEASQILDRLEVIERQLYENERDMMQKLRKILPAIKIIRLKKAERDFNKKLMKQFRDKHGKRKSMP